MLLGGQPTYRVIMENLKHLLNINKTITVDIRTNVDRRNMEDYNSFYQQFKAEIDDSRVNLYPGFVSDLLSSDAYRLRIISVPEDIKRNSLSIYSIITE